MCSICTIRFAPEAGLIHPESFFGQSIKSPPEKTVDEYNDENHGKRCGEENWIVANSSRFGNRRANAGHGPGLSSELGVFGNDARVPRATARRNQSSDDIREQSRQDSDLPPLPTFQSESGRRVAKIFRYGRDASNDIE